MTVLLGPDCLYSWLWDMCSLKKLIFTEMMDALPASGVLLEWRHSMQALSTVLTVSQVPCTVFRWPTINIHVTNQLLSFDYNVYYIYIFFSCNTLYSSLFEWAQRLNKINCSYLYTSVPPQMVCTAFQN